MRHSCLLLLFVPAIIIFWSCKKSKLDVPAIGLVDETKLANKKGVEGLLIGAYSLLDGFATSANSGYATMPSNWVYGSICGSEAYEGSNAGDGFNTCCLTSIETFSASSQNNELGSKWATIYSGVQRANEVLRMMKKAKDLSADDIRRISAEARFLRGFYHFEAIKIFNKVPYVDETVTYNAGNYYLANDTLIWPAIENDFRYAMNSLPEIMNAAGRVNKYAAEAFLAKSYLFQFQNRDKLAKAKPLLEELISSGKTSLGIKYDLNNNFADNFNAEKKNSKESVFAAQMSVNDGSGGANGSGGGVLNFPHNNGPVGCCGFFQPSQYLVNHFKTNPTTGLPDLNNFNAIDVKNDSCLKSSDAFTADSGTLDPRLDWTVGRREIPYLDWGVDPGREWIRDQDYGGPYLPKKNVYYQSQQGRLSDAAWANLNANNINLIRFADVLLWAAEVEIEIGSLDKAEDYVNRIRNRAANPAGLVHTYVDPNDPSKGFTNIPAANYFIKPYPEGDFAAHGQEYARKALRYERMLEFGMEGHRFFDLVRWGIADQEINQYLRKEKTLRSYLNKALFKNGTNECFPIPQTQIDLSVGPDGKQKLKQNPGY